MIPILYEKNEVSFTSNGLGRLRDCISCIVTEERNGIYECDFEYPITGAHYDLIQVGRVIGVTHDESDDIQPFDIVSYSKPVDGIVTFHCTHISYRQSYLTVTGSNIQSLSAAFTALGTATPTNPFNYVTDKASSGNLTCMDGTPRSVRQVLGGVEGSILDIYGGEYEWDRWTVNLWSSRGKHRDFTIRYGVNMLDYNEELDSSGCYSSCVPYWTDGTITVVGDKQTGNGITPSGRDQCVPVDVSESFETQPTKAQVESAGLSVVNSKNTTAPTQSISISFVRLQDLGEFQEYESLLQCNLCDTIRVIFPDYNSGADFKIVKTIWNVLTEKYEGMELGDLSISLSEALGVGTGGSYSGGGGGGGTTDYTDLYNKPQINNVTLSGNKSSADIGVADAVHTHTVSQITDFPSLSSVATSGDYNDLSNKPTIPTVNNATLTIQKNSTNVATFTANASTNVTADISVPTKVSDITNDSGFITSPNIPYCTCATAAGTKAKTTTIVSGTFTADDLVTGAQVLVKFTYSNTVADPTLKIGSTTAKTIKRYGTTAPSTSAASSWNAGAVVLFVYDGTYWQMEAWENTTYSSMTEAEITAGTGTTARTITPARLKLAVQTWEHVNSVNSKTGAVTLTASDVGALADTTTYVSSFNGNTGAVTYTAPVTSVNSKTGAVTLTASDVGALPNTTSIPSKLSDLTNDLIYDLGTVTPNDGVFSVSADDVTAITSLWNDGYCGLKLTVNSKDYYAFKERMITFNSLSFMGFVAVEADIQTNILQTGTTLVGINSNGIGMFAVIHTFDGDDVPLYEQDPIFSASAAHGIQSSDITSWNGKQDALVSGTNIKTINGNSLLGSGNLIVGGSQPVQEIFIAEYGVTTHADVLSAYNDNKAIFLKVPGSGTADAWTTEISYFPSLNDTFRFYFTSGGSTGTWTLLNDDSWSSSAQDYVPTTRKINNKALLADITLTAADVGALADTYTAPVSSVNSKTGAVSLSASDVGALATTGGEVSGSVTLKAAAGQNSPSLIFQRGTLTDNYNDWQIYDKSGFLYFGQRGQNSTAFADQVYFNTTGGVIATSFTGSGTNLTDVVHPARTINGKALSADITLTASDVGALADTYTAPVSSVNTKTGAVTLTASDVGALSSSTTYVSSVNGSSGAITGIQTTGNLVTSVTSASTDSEYPSAKLLYDITRKSVVQATGNTSSLSLTSGTITQIPLATYIANDETNATWNDTQKGIEILTAGYYKIKGSAYFSNLSASITNYGVYIKVASSSGAYSSASEVLGGLLPTNKTGSQYFVGALPSKMVYLNAHDIVYLAGRVNGAAGTIQPDNNATFLLVEQV